VNEKISPSPASGRKVTVRLAGLAAAVAVVAASLAGCGSARFPVAAARAAGRAGANAVSGAVGGTELAALLGNPASIRSASVNATRAVPGRTAVVTRLRGCVGAARALRASGHLAAARATWRSCVRRYLRLRWRLRRLLLTGLHGTLTVRTVTGIRTLAFERGGVQSVTGSSVVVRAADGTTWTWQLSGATLVFRSGRRVRASALAAGQQVVVAGPVVAGTDDASRVLIRP